MKFASLAASIITLALPTFAKVTVLTYDNTYDDPSISLDEVACSNGVNGLMNKSPNYTTLGSLPSFPRLGGAFTVSNWDSPNCGTCYNITYDNTTLSVLAVDSAEDGFNLSQEVMDTLTGGLAINLGMINVDWVQVNQSVCGIH